MLKKYKNNANKAWFSFDFIKILIFLVKESFKNLYKNFISINLVDKIKAWKTQAMSFEILRWNSSVFLKENSACIYKNKKPYFSIGNLFALVTLRRLERLTHSLEGCCSIQLSYRAVPKYIIVIEPKKQ